MGLNNCYSISFETYQFKNSVYQLIHYRLKVEKYIIFRN